VKSRILGLPTWYTNSTAVADLLVGHEVGHALWTPEEGIAKFRKLFPEVPFSVLNIVEDVRIERLIQNKYPGLVRSFREGYTEFLNEDFFAIKGKDLSEMGFLDRLNLKAKCGELLEVPFTDEEAALLDECRAAESFEDVLTCVENIVNHVGSENLQSKTGETTDMTDGCRGDDVGDGDDAGNSDDAEDGGDGEDAGDGDGAGKTDNNPDAETNSGNPSTPTDDSTDEEGGESDASAPSGESDSDEDAGVDSDASAAGERGGNGQSPFHSETQDALDRSLSKLTENPNNEAATSLRVLTPSHEELLDNIIDGQSYYTNIKQRYGYEESGSMPVRVEEAWIYKHREMQKNASLLAKEFERRKAAWRYSRATPHTTGKLDVSKVHAYKYDDQIFKSISTLADAKNHGMIFLIDFSGSMSSRIQKVTEQTIEVAMFCRKVGVPFEIYSFTSGGWNGTPMGKYHDPNERLAGVHIDFSHTQVVQLANSNMCKRDLDKALEDLWKITTLRVCGLGGTPLDEALLMLHAITDRFLKTHRVQKMNLIVLTDGDGHRIQTYDGNGAGVENLKDRGQRYSRRRPYIKIGKNEITIQSGFWNSSGCATTTEQLLKSLREQYDCNVVGFFIGRKCELKGAATKNARMNKKLGALYISNAFKRGWKAGKNAISFDEIGGYNSMFFIDSDAVTAEDEEFTPDSDLDINSARDRNRIAKQFAKSGLSHKASRLFCQKFAEMIA